MLSSLAAIYCPGGLKSSFPMGILQHRVLEAQGRRSRHLLTFRSIKLGLRVLSSRSRSTTIIDPRRISDDNRSGCPPRRSAGTERQCSPPACERHEDPGADGDDHATVAASPAVVGAGRGGHLPPEQG